VAGRLLAAFDGRGEALPVALCGQLAVELGDEQAAVGEDEDAERACGLDEPRRGDRLAGGRRMPEPVAADRARVGGGGRLLVLELLALHGRELELLFLLGFG